MFRGSFRSCRPRSMSDVMISDVEKPVFNAQTPHRSFQMVEALYPRPQPFPSMCRPRCPERCEMIENRCIVSEKLVPRLKVSERYPVFGCGDGEGRKCPPASPASPLNVFYDVQGFGSRGKRSTKKKKPTKKAHVKKNKKREVNYMFISSSADTNGGFPGGGGWFSSEDEREDETETLFSSKSLSSDSYDSQKRLTRRRNQRNRRRRGAVLNPVSCCRETNVLPMEGKVKDSFAVVKRSSDPYSDFRTSMVEMIVEKQIFAAKDLEQLLQCFLSLNSSHHHRIIIEVFTEIWEALFSNWS